MESMLLGSVAGSLGLFFVFGGLALICWIEARNKSKERTLAHQERLRALELGQPLPDGEIARAQTERTRCRGVALVGFGVPLSAILSAAGTTAMVLDHPNRSIHIPLTIVIWGIVGLVSLISLSTSLGILSRIGKTNSPSSPIRRNGRRGEVHFDYPQEVLPVREKVNC